jgi:hypothetical protein
MLHFSIPRELGELAGLTPSSNGDGGGFSFTFYTLQRSGHKKIRARKRREKILDVLDLLNPELDAHHAAMEVLMLDALEGVFPGVKLPGPGYRYTMRVWYHGSPSVNEEAIRESGFLRPFVSHPHSPPRRCAVWCAHGPLRMWRHVWGRTQATRWLEDPRLEAVTKVSASCSSERVLFCGGSGQAMGLEGARAKRARSGCSSAAGAGVRWGWRGRG